MLLLLKASGNGNLKLVQFLCDNGANIVDDKNNESCTPQYNGNKIILIANRFHLKLLFSVL